MGEVNDTAPVLYWSLAPLLAAPTVVILLGLAVARAYRRRLARRHGVVRGVLPDDLLNGVDERD